MKNKTKTQIGCSDHLIVRQTIYLHTKRVPVLRFLITFDLQNLLKLPPIIN